MSRLMGLYAQHLGAERQSPYASEAAYEAAVARAAELLGRAEFVVAGIGSGMSSACGYDHYHPIPEFADGGRVLFLELGVGGMTPGVIELPFWDMTAHNDNAFYLRVNVGKVGEPRQLGERSLTVCADIADVMDRMCALLGAREEER